MSLPKAIPVDPIPPLSVNQRLALNLTLKSTFGLVSSGLLSLLVARRAPSRMFVTGLGAGMGLGYGWCQNDSYLKDPKSTELPHTLQGEFDKYWGRAASAVPSFARFR